MTLWDEGRKNGYHFFIQPSIFLLHPLHSFQSWTRNGNIDSYIFFRNSFFRYFLLYVKFPLFHFEVVTSIRMVQFSIYILALSLDCLKVYIKYGSAFRYVFEIEMVSLLGKGLQTLKQFTNFWRKKSIFMERNGNWGLILLIL